MVVLTCCAPFDMAGVGRTLSVHPSAQDGFAYAVAGALACGVPMAVTADTGGRESVTQGVNGEVVPTDSAGAIRAGLEPGPDRDPTGAAPRAAGGSA